MPFDNKNCYCDAGSRDDYLHSYYLKHLETLVMIIDYEFIAGVKVGIESDRVYMMDEEENIDEEPTEVVYIHLGIVTISFIFN